jgi:hypothetical protein
MAIQGQPQLVVFGKNLGARPEPATACSVRVAVNSSEMQADIAAVIINALMICGSTLMSAFWMAITYGLAGAVDAEPRRDSSEGTIRLTQKAPRK